MKGRGPSESRRRIGAGLAVALALAVAVRAAPGDAATWTRDLAELTRGTHRLTGTPEGEAAAEYLASRLREIGADPVIVQPYPTLRATVRRCELQVEGRPSAIPLHPMRPNGPVLPVTPPDGIRGRIVHAGAGRAQDFAERSVRDAIVVLPFNRGEGWRRAFRLGAQAVIFAGGDVADTPYAHYVETPLNLPRFYYEGDPADLPAGAEAVLHSEVAWDAAVGRNVIGVFRGTDPVFAQQREEALILSAHYDTYGEVPTRTPGARAAANCAALLHLARIVQEDRPRRHIVVLFTDEQSNAHRGSGAFYMALERDLARASVATRRESWEAEHAFVEEMLRVLATDDPLHETTRLQRALYQRLDDRAMEHAFRLAERMYALRMERLRLEEAVREGRAAPDPERVDAIARRLDELQPDRDRWNDLRRGLGRRALRDLDPRVTEKLARILAEVEADLRLREAEMRLEAAHLEADQALLDALGDTWITLHAALALGDRTSRWGLLIGSDAPTRHLDDHPGLYGRVQSVFLRAYRQMEAAGRAPERFEVATVDQTLAQTRTLWAAPALVHSGEIAGAFGIFNLALGTVQENLAREGTPFDTRARLDLDAIRVQTEDIAHLLLRMASLPLEDPEPVAGAPPSLDATAVADRAGLSLRRGIVGGREYAVPRFQDQASTGPLVMGLLAGSPVPNTPMPGAVVQFLSGFHPQLDFRARRAPAFNRAALLRTNRNGAYLLGPVPNVPRNWAQSRGFAAVFDEHGRLQMASGQDSWAQIRFRANVVDARAGGVVLPPNFRRMLPGAEFLLLSALDDGALPANRSFRLAADGVFAWYAERRVPAVKAFNLHTVAALGIGPETVHGPGERSNGKFDARGDGFDLTGDWSFFPVARRSAVDLWRLNESRLRILQGANITDSALAELHGRAEDLLIAAEAMPEGLRAEALDMSAFLASGPVYRQTRATIDDLVFAVLILLGLAVPFAYALERILVGSVTVYRQIGWFAAFFGATFVILFFSHPAFAIANTPIIIFLGFTILVLSVMVISIIMRKFQVELRAMQGMTGTVHSADVSRMSTVMAAVQMGISTMRRRPLRTTLTAVTIILLTFTILSFASFGMQSGVLRVLTAPSPGYTGAWIHDPNWRALASESLDLLEGRWGDAHTISPRWWVAPQQPTDPGVLLTRADGRVPVELRGLLGIDDAELARRPDLAELLGESLRDRVLLTASVMRALGVADGDPVRVRGALRRVREVDAVALSGATDMDGSSILPVDFVEMQSAQPADDVTEEEALTATLSWTSLSPDTVAIVDADTAQALGGALHGVSVYTDDLGAARTLAGDLARILPIPVAATLEAGVYRHLLGTLVAASGITDLFFPILLGGLVIFGTMLGSVTDREREIYTFSALGLAPRHVATLFLAESMVYSLVGGMGGYLLAQGAVGVLTRLAEFGWVRLPEMNVSSTNTIVTILIVMATVLASAVYPAIKASKSANPGLMRSWRVPPPEGDTLSLVFPFTVSEYDITGVVSFLKEHFDHHSDTGLGHFMAQETAIERTANGALRLRARVALAPFDLGVSQDFALRSTPSEIPGIDEVHIRLDRRSGQPSDWTRLNRIFLNDLRQQFLIWRSIPQETMELYREQTLTRLGRGPAASPAPA